MKTAVIYARYSCERQTEQSIEGQVRVCTEYAEHLGYNIIHIYADRAVSGKTDHRADFQRMIKDSQDKKFNYVIVYKLDRFSRNRYDSALNKAILKKNGVKLLSACEQISDTPEGIILESMIEGYAEYYSAELSQKVKRGIRESRLKGNFTGGFTPYGFKIIDKKWTIDEAQAAIVRQIFNDYLKGVSIEEIVKKLNSLHIFTDLQTKFSKNKIIRMLKNKKYIGLIENGDEIYDNIVPSIIDKKIFERVTKRMSKKNGGRSHKRSPTPYILSGRMSCGMCNSNVVGHAGKSQTNLIYFYYKCLGRIRHSCALQTIRKEFLESVTLQAIFDKIPHKTILDFFYEIANLYDFESEKNALLEALNKQKNESLRSIKGLITAIENGTQSPHATARLQELESRLKETEKTIEVCEQEKLPLIQIKDLDKAIKGDSMAAGSIYVDKAMFIDRFIEKLILFDTYIEIHFTDGVPSKKVYFGIDE